MLAAQGERPGGPTRRPATRLDAYGRRFGLAFQITDDLLDVEGTSRQAGKRVGKDAARGKLTYPGLLGVDREPPAGRTLGRARRRGHWPARAPAAEPLAEFAVREGTRPGRYSRFESEAGRLVRANVRNFR